MDLASRQTFDPLAYMAAPSQHHTPSPAMLRTIHGHLKDG